MEFKLLQRVMGKCKDDTVFTKWENLHIARNTLITPQLGMKEYSLEYTFRTICRSNNREKHIRSEEQYRIIFLDFPADKLWLETVRKNRFLSQTVTSKQLRFLRKLRVELTLIDGTLVLARITNLRQWFLVPAKIQSLVWKWTQVEGVDRNRYW